MVPALGWSGAASVEHRRRIPVALVLLQIREKVREMRLGKARRTEVLEGRGGDGKPRVDGIPKVFSGEISWSSDLAAWRRFGKISRGEMERMVRGVE
jgi:hypothetical protein